MAKSKYNWPERNEMIALLRQYGTQTKTAQALGVPRTSLASRLVAENITEDDWAINQEIEPTEDVSREEILEQRVKELEALQRKERKVEVLDERILQAIETSAAASLPVYNATPRKRVAKPPSEAEHEMVLLWSDTHAGEMVSKTETNGLNEYNWDIMWQRQRRMLDAVLSYRENRPYKIERIHILALGDMLSGVIHDELEATNEMPYAETVTDFGVEGAAWLSQFANHFEHIHFTGVVGNHPRAHRKPRAKHSFDNGDWLVYKWMNKLLEGNEQFTFEIPKAAQHVHEVCGKRILLFHGDSVRSSMPGVPWGGVLRRVNALNATYGGNIDMFTCGHFHSAAFVQSDAGQVVMNGSVKGIDEYSLKAFGGGRPPQQLLLTFHPRYGMTDMSLLDLATYA